MSAEREHVDLKDPPRPISIESPADLPPYELIDALLGDEPTGVMIRNGHSSLLIPRGTLIAIKALDPLTQASILIKMCAAVKDASRIILMPKK